MKKFLSLLIAAILVVPAIDAAPVNAKREKELRKEAKAKAKELKKAGWEVLKSSRTLEGAINAHYDKLIELGDDAIEYSGVASSVKSKNNGVQMAINNACIEYAQQQGSDLQGKIVSDGSLNTTDNSTEMENFYNAYTRDVAQEIKGDMIPSYQVIRSNGDGTYEVQVYFIVSQESATKARLRALENAKKESEAAQSHARTIEAFVKDGYKN